MSEYKRMGNPGFNPVSAPDYLPMEKLRELQTERFARIIRRAYENVPFYRKRMEDRNLTPGDIKSLDDVKHLPFTIKADLRDTYPFGLFASPLKDIVRLHASSGTTGKPIVVAYTKSDLDVWQETMMRTMAAAGVSNDDIVQVSFGYGLFTGGLGAHYGAEGLGATVIPASGGNTERQIMLMKDFGVTVIACTPSYFVHMIEEAGKMGIDLHKLPLRRGLFGAEPWTEEMRRHIEESAGIKAFDIYLRGPLLPGDHRPRHAGSPAGRPGGRTCPEHAFKDGDAHAPLPDARPDKHHDGKMRLRTHNPPDFKDIAPQRRYVHHPRRQCLPVADRDRDPQRGEEPAALSDHSDAAPRARQRRSRY